MWTRKHDTPQLSQVAERILVVASDHTLLAEIERDLLDGRALADLLRKCIMLGGRSGSQELRDWAGKELRGYDPDDELPPYRVVSAPIMLDGISGNWAYEGDARAGIGATGLCSQERPG